MEDTDIIYNKYKRQIYNLAYRMTGNKEDAKDITQETFIQGFNSMDQFRGESQLYTWLFKVAKNKCLRFLEKKNRTTFVALQELVDKNGIPVSDEITETEKMNYISQVKEGCLSGLLRCLSSQQRLAFILNILLDLPVEQVARVIDKSENATRILIHRARQNIKGFLCRNCSLYDPLNTCRCENLISFSLKQGWISINNPLRIESEIKELKSVISLYKTIQQTVPTNEFDQQMKQLLAEKRDLIVLNGKKVK